MFEVVGEIVPQNQVIRVSLLEFGKEDLVVDVIGIGVNPVPELSDDLSLVVRIGLLTFQASPQND